MDVRSYRAATLRDALLLVQEDLGPDAAVLQTRRIGQGLLGRWLGRQQVEVTASTAVHVPSRFPDASFHDERTFANDQDTGVPLDVGVDLSDGSLSRADSASEKATRSNSSALDIAATDATPEPQPAGGAAAEQLGTAAATWDTWSRPSPAASFDRGLPQTLFNVFTDLVDADVDEHLARDLVSQLRDKAGTIEDARELHNLALQRIEAEMSIQGPIQVSSGEGRVVALVGPTGVGKTTTIAKLAANYRLREKCRVGLVTVDTYRIAAVEQLRVYADIIDLPMEVVGSPSEMASAIERLSHLDLILMDTAGRSPRDAIKIRELKAMLSAADADEVHLVMSATSTSQSLIRTAEQFSEVGTTAMVLTKLDESTSLGNLVSLWRSTSLPMSYVTNGQNVPDDIQSAAAPRLARWVLGHHG